ncbi:hypothetical protein [Polaribacter haliotis]|nr:hypothetical protein [Polaribacter haliotis]
MEESIIPIPKKTRDKVLKEIDEEAKESETNKTPKKKKAISKISVFGFDLGKMKNFYEDHKKLSIDSSLDSLGLEKNFKNRFIYQRVKRLHSVFEDDEEQDRFGKEIISYGSVALFIFLPLFTLFLKLFYIRRKCNYVDHLIFAFHTQTVLFMTLGIFLILSLFINIEEFWIPILLFLIYLYLAMKKFYNQGYIKTFFKFILLNFCYFILSIIGTVFIALISFAIY